MYCLPEDSSKIWLDFHHISTTRVTMTKHIPPFDSAHRIGLNPLLKEVRTVVKGSIDDDFKICDIGNVFAYIWRTSGDTVKRSILVDSARRIGPNMLFKEVLTAAGVSGW